MKSKNINNRKKKCKVPHPLNQEHRSQYVPTAGKSLGKHGIHSNTSKPFNIIAYLSKYKGIIFHFLIYPATKCDRKRKTRKKTFKPLRNLQDHLWTDKIENWKPLNPELVFNVMIHSE